MKATICGALLALSTLPLLPTPASASRTLKISHQPIEGLVNEDGSIIHYDFLNQRFTEQEASEIDFRRRKRDLSGAGSKRSQRECRDTKQQSDKSGRHHSLIGGVLGGVGGLVGGVLGGVGHVVDGVKDGLTHYVENGWMHDHKFGIVIAKAENEAADNEFLVDVSFGTPGQTLQMVLDTGSPEAWVYSPVCCYGNNHSSFDPAQSLTYLNRTVVDGKAVPAPPGTPGQDFNVAYSSGSATRGYVGLDTFAFEKGKFRVDGLPLALATNLTGSRRGRQMDGLIGLATGSGTQVPGGWTTAFEAMSQRGMLDETYLTATLVKSDRKTGRNGGGQYVFGEVDKTLLKGDVTWSKVLSAFFWAGYVSKINIDGLVLAEGQGNATNPIRFLVDTGSATISMPPVMAKAANAQIYGSYKTDSKKVQLPWLVPCDTGLKKYEAKLPKGQRNKALEITFGTEAFSLPIEDYVFFPQYPVPASEAGGRENMCYSAIQEGLSSFTLLGLSWIKNHVVVFDQGGPSLSERRVGFGKRRDVKYDV
ncbi:uncharacterized protein PFL1_06442 [Pseudozyma flocculosa PF-1]|uniref:Related to pepsinogen n=2 Tax=Pseudozyma flocculosa TaxID=84751 RepID=A0A5C3EX94_9BASI|nr:uncharacterized protein PFL1_06442 [Pseudozyma flocculosa PF-1]EPQ25987.1 hypothetical protein PFL1_06442 [Pseudozyma flocculosa PF-1]SPO35711.1 related to pepsinogen precursor [Pseudozyma flocculosa]